MLTIKNVSARNFMSIGAQTQAVNFDNNQLTLVLGHNLDLGGDGSRRCEDASHRTHDLKERLATIDKRRHSGVNITPKKIDSKKLTCRDVELSMQAYRDALMKRREHLNLV